MTCTRPLGLLMGVVLAFCPVLFGCIGRFNPHVQFQQEKFIEGEAKRSLIQQAEAWNRGDFDGFMSGYWNSEFMTFSIDGKTQRGWKATYDCYRARYPTPERMGRLSIGELDVRLMSSAWSNSPVVCVLGRWYVSRDSDPIGGNFLQVVRKMSEGWRIMHDHASVDADARVPRGEESDD